MGRGQDRKLSLVPVKSATSRRLLHIDAGTVDVLRRHKVIQLESKLLLGSAYDDQGQVFVSPTGGLLDPDYLTKEWQRICKRVGVKYRLHDLRHHHITELLASGVNVRAVQTRAGHSSPGITLARYAHVTPQMDQEAAERYAQAMS